MEREFYNKSKKAQANILKCIEEGFRNKDLNIIMTNVQRLNDLARHFIKHADLMMIRNSMLEAENALLESENRKLMDEKFLQISDSKGRYSEAKKMLDDFYNGQ